MIPEPAVSSVSVFFHNYYGSDAEWLQYLSNEIAWDFQLFYNGVYGSYFRANGGENMPAHGSSRDYKNIRAINYRESTNQGKDIGGKLVLLDAYLRLGSKSDYMLFLHDKASPYHYQGARWRQNLFRISEKQHAASVMAAFSDPKVGIVASQTSLCNESDNEQQRNAYINAPMIEGLRNRYNVHPPGLQFVAGTMFWVRSFLFEDFFRKFPPLQIRATLEAGNITDENPTATHAWERLLCWIVTGKGYLIKGI